MKRRPPNEEPKLQHQERHGLDNIFPDLHCLGNWAPGNSDERGDGIMKGNGIIEAKAAQAKLIKENHAIGLRLKQNIAYSEILEGAVDTVETELAKSQRENKILKDCNTLSLCVLGVVAVLLATGVLVIQFK